MLGSKEVNRINEKSVSERLQKSIVLYSALGILVISVIVALVSVVPLYKHLKKSTDRNLLLARNTKGKAIGEYLSRVQDTALQITSRTRIRDYLDAYNRGEIGLGELVNFTEPKLVDAMNLSEEVVGISRLDSGGELVVQVGVPIPEIFWPIPAGDSKETIVRGPVALEGESYLVVGTPIIDNQSVRVGTDIVLFKLERLEQIVQDYAGLGETGEAVLGVADNDQIQLLFPLRKGDVTKIVLKSSPIGLALERALQQDVGMLYPGEVYDSPEVMAYGPVEDSKWGIVIKMNQEELYAPVIGQIATTGSIILVLVMFGSFGMGLLIRPLTEKMVVLEQEIRAKTVALESELNERKRAEAALQRRTEELRVVFDTTPIPLIVVDSDLRIQQANKATQALSDLPEVEMTGKRLGEALHCIHYLDIPEGCGFGEACQTCITRNTVQETFRTE